MLIDFKDVAFGYGDNLIFSDVNFAVNEGSRIALVGENGAGKTTLIKLMLGQLIADSGAITIKNGIKTGYLEQNGGYDSGNTVYAEMLEVFREELAAIEKIGEISNQLTACEYGGKEYARLSARLESLNKYVAATDAYNVEVKIKTVLNGMGFSGFYDRNIDTMSGGEKTRLKLARLLLEQPDLLILDEPTNHLDMETREALTMALSTYEGAVLIVSHDRHLLRATTERLILVHDGAVQPYDGDLDDYAQLVLEHRRTTVAAEKAANQAERLESGEREPSQNRKEARRAEAQERQRIAALRKPLQKELAKVEKELAQKNEELRKLSDRLADGDFYTSTDPDEVARVLREHGELKPVVEELEMRWLELSEEIEAVC